jgi:O-antigen ligase
LALPWFFQPIEIDGRGFAASELLLLAAVAGSALRVGVAMAGTRDGGPFEVGTIVAALRASKVWLAAWGLAGLGALHLIWLDDRTNLSAAAREWRWTLLEPAIFVTLLTVVAFRSRAPLFFVACLVAAMTIAALAGMVDLVSGDGVRADGVRRADGAYRHPNALALFLVRGWAVTAAWWTLDPQRRAALTAPLLLGAVGVLLTLSRGGLVACALVVLLLAMVATRRFRIVALGTMVASIVLMLVVAGARMLDSFSGGSASLRIDIWTASLAMIRDKPLWGYGPDGFLYAYTPRYVAPTAWAERFTSHAHNLFLDFWVRLGIIGAAIAALAIGACIYGVVAFVRDRHSRATLGTVAIFGGIAAIMHGMVDSAYFTHDLAMTAWLLVWLAFVGRTFVVGEDTESRASAGGRRFGIYRVAPLR